MKQIVPFYKEIVFENKIANIVSVSLEHNEKILDGEVSGEFILCGEYKSHNDTTEVEEFKYKLPFTALIPDDVDINTVCVDITNFNYEQIEENVLRVDIDFSIEGEELKREELEYVSNEVLDEEIDKQIDEIICAEDNNEVLEEVEDVRAEVITKDIEEVITDTVGPIMEIKEEIKETKEDTKEEYVTYHVHVVSNKDSIESIMKTYNVNIDLLKEYNDIKELKIGDKVLIPEYLDE